MNAKNLARLMTETESAPPADQAVNSSEAKPLVYSCSGCSNVAQLANNVAVYLDRTHTAQMSCIAGVGAGIKSFVNLARSDRNILCLDGCAHRCAMRCLANHSVTPTWHLTLTDLGLTKENHEDASTEDFNSLLEHVKKLMPWREIEHEKSGT